MYYYVFHLPSQGINMELITGLLHSGWPKKINYTPLLYPVIDDILYWSSLYFSDQHPPHSTTLHSSDGISALLNTDSDVFEARALEPLILYKIMACGQKALHYSEVK